MELFVVDSQELSLEHGTVCCGQPRVVPGAWNCLLWTVKSCHWSIELFVGDSQELSLEHRTVCYGLERVRFVTVAILNVV